MLQRYSYCMPGVCERAKLMVHMVVIKPPRPPWSVCLSVWPWMWSRAEWRGMAYTRYVAWSGDDRSTHTFRRRAPRTHTPQLTDGARLDKVIIIENCPLFKASSVPPRCYLRNLGRRTHLVGISWKLPEVFHSHQSISTPARINPTEKPRRNSTRATSK